MTDTIESNVSNERLNGLYDEMTEAITKLRYTPGANFAFLVVSQGDASGGEVSVLSNAMPESTIPIIEEVLNQMALKELARRAEDGDETAQFALMANGLTFNDGKPSAADTAFPDEEVDVTQVGE